MFIYEFCLKCHLSFCKQCQRNWVFLV